MRVNSPVSQQESIYRDNAIIISKTDRKGIIREGNKDFVEISGYTRDELIGQPHNILRHPAMPVAAFRDLWDNVKAGRVWDGIVKNRCKNGDYYWVEANVTPIFEGDEIAGYVSVRTKPSPEQVKAAEKLYEKLNSAGKKQIQGFWGKFLALGVRGRMIMLSGLIAISPLVAALLGANGFVGAGVAVMVALMLTPFVISSITRPLHDLTRTMMDVQGKGELAKRAPVHRNDEIGQAAMAFNAVLLTFRGITAEVNSYAQDVKVAAESLHAIAEKVHETSSLQSEAAQAAAAAMEQMAVSISSVSDNTADVKAVANQSRDSSMRGQEGVSHMVNDVDSVASSVENISSSFKEFLESTQAITAITKNVRDIAEQTNLLALNAAIEAARAGESGRGFAVVADEVRKLAEKSAASANKIDEITLDVNVHSSSVESAISGGLEHLTKLREYLAGFKHVLAESAEAVSKVSAGVNDIANATCEQAAASNDVAQNVERIANVAEENNRTAYENNQAARELKALAETMQEAVNRFSTE